MTEPIPLSQANLGLIGERTLTHRAEVVDRLADRLSRAARRQREDPLAFIADQDLFGELADDQRFTAAYTRALASLYLRGARATLESLD